MHCCKSEGHVTKARNLFSDIWSSHPHLQDAFEDAKMLLEEFQKSSQRLTIVVRQGHGKPIRTSSKVVTKIKITT